MTSPVPEIMRFSGCLTLKRYCFELLSSFIDQLFDPVADPVDAG
jgi:hypothetical protein